MNMITSSGSIEVALRYTTSSTSSIMYAWCILLAYSIELTFIYYVVSQTAIIHAF